MSRDVSFREKLARPAVTSASDRGHLYSPVEVRIEISGDFAHPVALAKLLRDGGMRLAEAHDAVSRLANDGKVNVLLRSATLDRDLESIRDLGLAVTASEVERASFF